MAIKGNALQRSFLNFLFCSSAPPSGVDVATSSSTLIWVALLTSDPGASGNQSTDEISFTGYHRIATQRTASGADLGGWVFGDAPNASPTLIYPMSPITFPVCSTASTVVIGGMSVGVSSSGGTNKELWYSGGFAIPPILVQGSSPVLTTGTACGEN